MEEDVITESSPVSTEVNVESPVELPQEPTPGSKTPQENLLAALKEERAMRKAEEDKRKALEEEVQTLKTTTLPDTDVFSDEGKMLKDKITGVEAQIEALREERELERVHNRYPELKDKSAEFDEFRKDYPRHKLENVAKLFLVEHDLTPTQEPRKGLEQPSGGSKTPIQTGTSAEEVKTLRETNYRKYMELVQAGKIII
jgi:hypothetical protein